MVMKFTTSEHWTQKRLLSYQVSQQNYSSFMFTISQASETFFNSSLLLQVSCRLKHFLILRGLSLFFKILPISNTGDSIAYILATVHFLYPKLSSFSDMEQYFHQLAYRDSKVHKHFIGLNQMQCSPSFDWNCGKQNDPTACWYQLHP